MLTPDQLRRFAADGYLVVPNVVGSEYLDAADDEIDRLIGIQPPPPGTAGNHFYFLPPDQLPAARSALVDSGALAVAEELTAPLPLDLILDHIQVALNLPPWEHRPGGPHIDGHRPDQAAPASFTLLAGIFLADELGDQGGNLWVWPGSHLVHQQLFHDRGPHTLLASSGHITLLESPRALAAPVAVEGHRGDLLLAHFLLGHNSGGNLSSRVRRMIYYRLGCPGHANRWATTLTDAFTEYAPVRRAASS